MLKILTLELIVVKVVLPLRVSGINNMAGVPLGTCHNSHLPGTLHCSFKQVELVYILFLLNNIYEQASNIGAVS